MKKAINIPRRNLIAILITVLPLNLMMIIYRIIQTEPFTLSDMLIYPLLIGIPSILFILFINKFLLKSSFNETFNPVFKTWDKDILFGILLVVIYFINLAIDKYVLMPLFPNNHIASEEVINALIELANSPLLILLWFGPVLWLGIALFEEVTRTFALKCLWSISGKKHWQFIAVIIVSIVTGLTHMYQGIAGVISIAVKSIIVGIFYYKYRRIYPLVIAHALYDGIQFGEMITQFKGM
jgi:membrane protease YdiL (CAAX protease family)